MAYTATVHLDWGVFFVVEIPAASARPLMPPGLALAEAAPGTVLLAVNVVHFLGGGAQVDLAENFEIDIGVSVPVDNAGFPGLPLAASAVHVLNIASTSASYLDYCRRCGYRGHASKDIRFDLDLDALGGTVRDGDGPILSFALRDQAQTFAPFARIGQDVVHDERGTYRLNYVFRGEGLAEPIRDACDLALHDHPFFRGLPVAGPGIACREQFALRPRRQASIDFYGPEETAAPTSC